MGLQASGGPVKDAIHSFNDLVLWIIIAITIFVAALLAYAIWRFDAKRNPVPSQNSHNTPLEIAWTVVPVLILLVSVALRLGSRWFPDDVVLKEARA